MMHELTIFNEIYQMIDDAEQFIVLDMFLFDHYSDEALDFPKITEKMTTKLVNKKKDFPEMPIVFITDPLNSGYGSYDSKWFSQMEEVGIDVVYANLNDLRDSFPLYSGLYRMLFQWFDFERVARFENSMSSDAPKMKLASYLTLFNIKANHRKTIVTDKEALVTSSNPHDASGFHGNVALKVKGAIVNDILLAEESVVKYTNGGTLPRVKDIGESEGEYAVQYLTEQKISDAMLDDIGEAQAGDKIRLGMFFIAKRDLVTALIDASNRGVKVEMILDPNENSFGSEKTGLPNRPVAQEMTEDTDGKIDIKWYNTVVGQYHTKLLVVETVEATYISNGSANLTSRTLDNYNLEANLRVIAPNDSELMKDIDSYFNRLLTNEDALYTLKLEEFQDRFTFFQRGLYFLQKVFKVTTY